MNTENPSEPSTLVCLDQFLKFHQLSQSGGQAKWMIQNGEVQVNGAVETRRRRKLHAGDIVEVAGRRLTVTMPVSG